jgi:hypothetical protein
MMQCLSCAYDNPEAQKFCGNCGAPLSPAAAAERLPLPASYTPPHLAQRILTLRSALEGERKLVTVLFVSKLPVVLGCTSALYFVAISSDIGYCDGFVAQAVVRLRQIRSVLTLVAAIHVLI